MSSSSSLALVLLALVSLLHPSAAAAPPPSPSKSKTYILQLLKPPTDAEHRWWHEPPRLVHAYTHAFTGLAARLTDAELATLCANKTVRAFPDQLLRPATTHTPHFLGLDRGAPGPWKYAGYGGKGAIIGVLDTGIYAPHPSFHDAGVPPPPSRWKGSCHQGAGCNNKLIGAKFFTGDGGADDDTGHGTHTSSTAAGNFVPNAASAHYGLGRGTAAGTAPGAHLAMYRVCTLYGCSMADVLAGIDEAVKDGVDVLSLSIAPNFELGFDRDPIAIGAFGAIAKGIVVVAAAGNNGPHASFFLANHAPWFLTVAAGSVDRSFQALVQLGNGDRIKGEAFNQQQDSRSSSSAFPLYSAGEHCKSLAGRRNVNVSGKIVICHDTGSMNRGSINKSDVSGIMSAGAAGILLVNRKDAGFTTLLQNYGHNVVQLTVADGNNVTQYVTTAKSKASASVIYRNTVLGVRPSPTVAAFSSRGPSKFSPGVLKPDILAPGLNILAAWPPLTLFGSGPFNIRSGTSMSAPHVSGIAALVKSSHPDWSPAAIKSAILTTADIIDSMGDPILDEQHQRATAYAMGAGHVNPTKAIDPGLVYDIAITEYAGYICALLGDRALAIIAHDPRLSCNKLPNIPEAQLNYPTITVPLETRPFTVNRTVTNVGPRNSIYTLKMDVPNALIVRVWPEKLVFSKAGQKMTYSITVSSHANDGKKFIEGSLIWVSRNHVVRSPIIAVVGLGSPM